MAEGRPPLAETRREKHVPADCIDRPLPRCSYVGDPDAIADGKRHYETWCQACHLPDGSGRIGPSLIDDVYGYERTKTDIGMFEIIYAGGTGAMQPFRDRLTQDQILKVIAYVHSQKR